MASIEINPLGGREFEVKLDEAGRDTTHRVSVPERLDEAVDLHDHQLESVVRTSFEFLLEREPASSILPSFSLDEISRYFPEYPRELARRLP